VHYLVEVSVLPNPELLADALWEFGAVGVEELDGLFRAAFTDRLAAERAVTEVGGTITAVDDHEGADQWRAFATTTSAGGFLLAPAWTTDSDERTLGIDPGRTFGSGSHPSTRLALTMLSELVGHDIRVADLGAGSGVLSVAAARLGGYAAAYELDPDAAAIIAENARRNGVADRVTTQIGDLRDTAATITGCELAVLNVTIDLHEQLGPLLRPFLPDRLIVAGVLTGAQETRAAAAHQRTITHRISEGDWAALLLDHPNRSR
jgi:ribosomal protein L11 methyltransferase